MKPSSDTGWWIVTYTIVLVGESEDPPREPPLEVVRKQVIVRCEHWREAFMKARRIGITEEDVSKGIAAPNHWQYLGINSLTPIPTAMEDGMVVGTYIQTSEYRTLEDLFCECNDDYQFEEFFDEERGGQYYRAIIDTNKAGF